ncbi:MAG: hypothetical protein CML20_20840 [Rheinheimera sp.]|uniref:hypothetical protein n=1 Tax=Arsukibacterium sp. UBA3155 TaxID=1946058 RepID=UPI000C8C5898|nr:hypothetical protein [Arsukibacterium sp. UBA3155]MAD77196.1 hypothetical protein [Rheinheimera sp.]|tara:strand:+ start:30749 stop:30997 length:249 start_codon:yes stop_codon:yes gene_type:complete
MTDFKQRVNVQPKKLPTMPKRFLNRALVYIGVFGIVFQLTAALYALWHGVQLQPLWFVTLLAPLLCIASGMLPALQLQREPD